MNAYQALNEEMKRLYEERDYHHRIATELSARTRRNIDPFISNQLGKYSSIEEYHYREHYDRYMKIDNEINRIRNILVELVKESDNLIQEKIAEMALTGGRDE